MPRPCKWRYVGYSPDFRVFSPTRAPLSALDEVCLTFDEIEALRLADYEDLYQDEAAQRMKISRQTFGNIVSSARRKIADFLLNGKKLIIEGGTVMTAERFFKCFGCGNEWSVPFGEERPLQCPKCNSSDIERIHKELSEETSDSPMDFGQDRKIGWGRAMGRGMGRGRGRGRCCGGGSVRGNRGR